MHQAIYISSCHISILINIEKYKQYENKRVSLKKIILDKNEKVGFFILKN